MNELGALSAQSEAGTSVMTRAERFRLGLLDATELTDEECARGVIMNEDGTLPMAPSRRVPRALFQERLRRLFEDGDRVLQDAYLVAVRALFEIVSDPNVSPGDRLRASQMIMDRVRGKDVVTVKLSAEDPVETLFKMILADPDGLAPALVEPKML